MKLAADKPKQDHENLLPLVNVVFLLLVFFMVTGAFSSPEPFSIEPVIAETDTVAEPKTVTIIMSSKGEFAIDNEIMSIDQVIYEVESYINNNSLKKLQLKSDAEAEALHVVELLERLGKTDIEAIHILTSAKP